MNNLLLLIFPIAIVIILLIGLKLSPGKECFEDAWGLRQSKSLQAVAALMIVLHHLVQTVTEYGDVYKGPITEWNSFGVLFTSVFFFFSGFGLYSGYKKKEGYLNHFLRKHLPKLLIPFAVTNLIYLLVLAPGRVTSALDVFTSFFGLTLINTNAWFLVELIILYIAFNVCFSYAKNEDRAFVYLTIFTVIMTAVSLLTGHDNSSVNGHWFMGEWWYNTTLIFILGMAVAKNEDKLRDFMIRGYKVLLPVVTLLLVAAYILEEYVLENVGYYREWRFHPGYPEKLVTLAVQLLLCALFMLWLLLVSLKVQFSNRILTFLGGISFELYLIHDVFRQSLYSKDRMPDAEYFALIFAFSILAAWLLSVVDKYIREFYFDNEKLFLLSAIKGEEGEDEELSYEAKQKNKKIAKVVLTIKSVYAVAAVGLIVTFVLWIINVTITQTSEFKQEMSAIELADVGDTVEFGEWELIYRNGKTEKIPWIVCDRQDNHVLLVSKEVLANISYHDKHEEVDWKDSKLCRILNHDFYMEAFTGAEREVLCGRYDEKEGSWCTDESEAFEYFINEEGKNDFEDVRVKKELVFILTAEETQKYLTDDSVRTAYASMAAREQGIGTFNNNYLAPWWLEDCGESEMSAMYVGADGSIDSMGKTVNNAGMGVRPAIWVKLD